MKSNIITKVKKNSFSKRKKQDIVFYTSLFVLPCLQFLVFYVGVKLNSIIKAFLSYELNLGYGQNGYNVTFAGVKNFVLAIDAIKTNAYIFKYTFLSYATSLIIGSPLSLIFSFYIYKKFPLSKIFKVMLFMPSLISGLVFSLLFNYITTDVYITLQSKLFHNEGVTGLLYNRDTRLVTVLFYNIWISFGGKMLLYSGSMSGIDESIVESAHIDGVNMVQEFVHITLPLIYPTILQLLILGIAGIFSNQMGLMSLYGLLSSEATEMATFGMYFYIKTQNARLSVENGMSIGVLSAMGVCLTLVLLPIVVGVRKLLVKLGPSVE